MLRAAGYEVKNVHVRGEHARGPRATLQRLHHRGDAARGHDGFDLLEALDHVGCSLPTIFLTGHGTIPSAVRAIRQGAEDFLSKSVEPEELLSVVHRAMERDLRQRAERVRLAEVKLRMRSLTAREREVLEHVLQGQRNKEIARELDIHERTVKLHRTNIATKLRVRSVAVMSRLAEESGAFFHGRADNDYRFSSEPGVRAGSGARAAAPRESVLGAQPHAPAQPRAHMQPPGAQMPQAEPLRAPGPPKNR
jgi:FixJ family two-component response regulator